MQIYCEIRVRAAADEDADENRLKCVKIFLIIFFLLRKPKGPEGLSSSTYHAIIKYTRIACTLYIPIYLFLQHRDTIPSS